MHTLKFKTNINCGNCIRSVTPFLNERDEIETWKVDTDHPDKILEVTGGEGLERAVDAALSDSGFVAEPIEE